MKNVYMTVLLCATGLVTMSGAFAATATVEQWHQSVTSYPERHPGFSISEYGNDDICTASMMPTYADRFPPVDFDILGFRFFHDGDRFRAFGCNKGSSGTCPDGTKIAIAGTAWVKKWSPPQQNEIYKHENYVWQCAEEEDLIGYDEWFPDREIPLCAGDDYMVYKNVNNSQAYLYDPLLGKNLYAVISNPSDHVCITYACAPEYKPNMDISTARLTSSNVSQLKCVGRDTDCPLYDDSRIATEDEYLNLRKTAKCNAMAYFDVDGAGVNNPNATHGTLYIEQLRAHMNEELADNISVARNLYNKRSDKENSSYTCDDSGCGLKEHILNAGTTNCDYLCTNNGFAVRLSAGGRNPCPMYFKQEYDTTKKIYVCNFDADAVNGTITQMDTDAANAVAQQRARCAQSFCTASGGVYSDGNCTCNNEPCNGRYSYSGHTYAYCDKQKIKGVFKRCDNNMWSSSNMNTLETEKNEVWIPNLQTCMSNANASSINATNDDISKLAGRLAAIEGQFGLSKWRTAEGKFNTARLASDLTAGVVLGTTGALVTSSVVKKKQVKDGFESLECTVGGQHVGDWGDVFRIDGK